MVIVGIDEAGRGCWAGPLVAAAVVLAKPIKGVTDSKRLSRLQREKYAEIIKDQAIAVSTGWVTPAEIDEIGLTKATQQAMKAALDGLKVAIDEIIIDGNLNYLPGEKNVTTLVGADRLIPSVSAASIIAKTERDAYMYRAAVDYPQYSFEKHVGYGTALHSQLLKLHGACELHRLSYRPLRLLAG